ncbi:DUF433 domain-containing protein [Actinocorallia sp. B10E7]|uniref:DUF433 domain-containing protein n=1 Tax=Actinocorallia sp. B10E7 TaxID=3153558 RepID=UPI00325C3EEA
MAVATEDIRFTRGLLNVSDASRYLGIARSTFQGWANDGGDGPPLLHTLAPRPRRASVTFVAFAEAHVLKALSAAGVRPQRIRPALKRLQNEFGRDYVLIAPELATDGIDVLWDFSRSPEGEGLIEGATGQRVMREIVEDYLQYVTRDEDGYPRLIELMTFLPSKAVIDPWRAFGQPIFPRSGTRVGDVAAMLSAGEDPEVVADELDVTSEEVRAAARVLLGRRAA